MKINFIMLALFFINYWLLAVEPVAIITKLRGTVKYKVVSESTYRTNAHVNTSILSDSQIQTQKNAFTKIVFLDDGTILSMYPETKLIIQGVIDDRLIKKQIELEKGIIHINVAEQGLDDLKLIASTSEIKCKRCSFWAIANQKNVDQFILESGDAVLYNPSVNSTMELIPDSTIFSKDKIEFEQLRDATKHIFFTLWEIAFSDRKIQLNNNTIK